MVTLGTVDHWDVIGQKGTLRQAEVVTAGSMVSEAVVRQAGNRDHTGTGMFTVAQSVGQWVSGSQGLWGQWSHVGSYWSEEPPSVRPVTATTQGQRVRGITLAETSVRGTLEQAWSVGATQVVGSVESHPGQSAGRRQS